MDPSSCRRAARRVILSVAGLLLSGCQSAPATGVRLAISYDATPDRLRLSAYVDDGRAFGPELLPDPPRPLAAGSESVLLRLTDALHGRTLELEVEGLDRRSAVMARGSRRVRVVRGMIVETALRMTAALGCGDDRMPLPDGGCAPDEGADAATSEPSTSTDASMPDATPTDASAHDAGSSDGGCGARCMDASRPDDVAPGASVPHTGTADDAGCPASPSVCGDLRCCDGENSCSCPGDCGIPVCGDGNCCAAAGEDSCKCSQDCGRDLCATLPCPVGSDCDLTCVADATCLIDCAAANTCSAQCAAFSVCNLDCTGANNCRSKCGPNSECTIQCAGANNCDEIECGEDAACIVFCADAENCKFKRCDGTQTECPDGTLVCGRSCP